MQHINIKPQQLHISFVRLLGEGGFGKVFLADIASGHGFQQQAAVKVLHPQFQHHPELLVRQLDEARMLGLLNHRNIVKVYDVCEIDGQMSILMEYVEGVSLSKLLKFNPVPWGVALQWVSDCAAALHDAHQAHHPQTGRQLKLIHRDIKPSNLLISRSGTLKLLDFGIAKMDGVREAKTSTHQMGTERYMAPEQWLENTSSASVDIYALGRTMLEMLYGKLLPRCPLDVALHDQSIQRLVEEIPSVVDDSVPQIILDTGKNLLLEMLNHDPTRRPSAEEVADRALCLAEAIGVGSVRTYMASVFESLSVTASGVDSGSNSSMLSNTQTVQTSSLNIEVSSLGSLKLVSGGLSASVPSNSERASMDLPLGENAGAEAAVKIDSDSTLRLLSRALALVFLLGVFGLYGFMTLNANVEKLDASVSSSSTVEAIEKEDHGTSSVPTVSEGGDTLVVEEPLGTEDHEETQQAAADEPVKAKVPLKKQPVSKYEVVISSVPLGADVYLDGQYMGKSLLTLPAVSKGTHRIRLELGENSIHKKLSIRDNGRFVWRMNNPEGETWFSY